MSVRTASLWNCVSNTTHIKSLNARSAQRKCFNNEQSVAREDKPIARYDISSLTCATKWRACFSMQTRLRSLQPSPGHSGFSEDAHVSAAVHFSYCVWTGRWRLDVVHASKINIKCFARDVGTKKCIFHQKGLISIRYESRTGVQSTVKECLY
jgi:hypothetical protein